MNTPVEACNLFVGAGVVIRGSAEVPGAAVIDGQFDGQLKTHSLEVLPQGVVSGAIVAARITIAGKLNDDVCASESLTIEASGIVSGNIAYAEVEVARGGQLVGNISQLASPDQPAAARPVIESPDASRSDQN